MTPEPEPLTKAHLQMLKELEEKHNPYGVSELSDWHYALEDAWPKILATIKARGERIAELEDIVADWSQSAERVQEDRCHEDERHCGCVVFLRKRIADLERGIDAAAQKASTRVADMPGADPLVVLREVEVDLENLLKEMEEKP